MLELKSVSKLYGEHKVLKDISMYVNSGEVVGIVGLNGAGKSTLMRAISGAAKVDSGIISLHNMNRAYLKNKEIKNKVSLLSTSNNLYGELSVKQNLEIFKRIYGATDENVNEVIRKLDINSYLEKSVSSLSTGMRKRAEIASVTMHNFSLLLLDEPTNGLDIEAKEVVLNYINSIRKPSNAIIVTSHNTKDIERLCNRIYVLREGSIVKDTTVGEMIGEAEGSNKYWMITVKDDIEVRNIIRNNHLRRRVIGENVEIIVTDEEKKGIVNQLASYDIISIKSIIKDLEDAIRSVIREDM